MISFHFISSVNHRELIDHGLTRDNGDDLQVYYHANGQHPAQIDRILSGLGTKSATVQFRLQAPMSANTVDDSSYFLVLGGAVSGSAIDNPNRVYAFHDDFSSSVLKKESSFPLLFLNAPEICLRSQPTSYNLGQNK